MIWTRIDNRLIHGQIIETWLPYTHAQYLIVANDGISQDAIQQQIMALAIPQSVKCLFVKVADLQNTLIALKSGAADLRALVLFANCTDVMTSLDVGYDLVQLNIGNLHYEKGKKQLSPSVAVNCEEESCLRALKDKGVELDFRCVPNDPLQVRF